MNVVKYFAVFNKRIHPLAFLRKDRMNPGWLSEFKSL